MGLTWTGGYATDVPEIDDQHRGLFDITSNRPSHGRLGRVAPSISPLTAVDRRNGKN